MLVAAALFLMIGITNTGKARFEDKNDEAHAAPPEDVPRLHKIRDVLER